MHKLSDNYYKRKCFLEREQVPSQSVIRKTMSPELADVYFKSMNPKLKALAGLEPMLRGGGTDWFAPPSELLRGRAVMKPTKKEYLSQLGFSGIVSLGEATVQDYKKSLVLDRVSKVIQNDYYWRKIIADGRSQYIEAETLEAVKRNSQKIATAYRQFTAMCCESISDIQTAMFDAGRKEVTRVKENTFKRMHVNYEIALKRQATMLYNKYESLLTDEKEKLKAKFIEELEIAQTDVGNQLHDINYEKHLAIEKLRKLLQCQNLACQVYVALKERDEGQKETDLSKHKHEKTVRKLKDQININDFEISLNIEKEKEKQEFIKIWQQKVCEVVKKFQLFVAYALHSLPDHADFFMDVEKLMMLQFNEALDNPDAENMFEPEGGELNTPIPRPHPFFLFCDKGFKPNLDQNLCPKHCTSSASQLPVIVVNKRCIYAACDNMEKFTDKVTQYIRGRRGEEKDFQDDVDYSINYPVKFTQSRRLQELKLKSSLLQVIQSETPNIRNVPVECGTCKTPYCFCTPLDAKKMSSDILENVESSPFLGSKQRQKSYKTVNRALELVHEREPKWDSYMNYVKPKKCKCFKLAKKHLEEHLPPYMRQMSAFDAPELHQYEPCSVDELKKLVKKAQGRRTPPPRIPEAPRKRDASTQDTDAYYDLICTCFSDEEMVQIVNKFMLTSELQGTGGTGRRDTVAGSMTGSFITKSRPSFALERALSLKKLIKNSPELEEIFINPDCNYIQ